MASKEQYIVETSKVNHILTYWIKIKLKLWSKYKQQNLRAPTETDILMIKLYNEYEERKRLKKIKFFLLFEDNFITTKIEETDLKLK
jgi:hypothetical protein